MSVTEIKDLIKVVGINLININILWIGLLPYYFMSPIYCNIKFYGYKYSFNIYNIIPFIQGYLTLQILDNIKHI